MAVSTSRKVFLQTFLRFSVKCFQWKFGLSYAIFQIKVLSKILCLNKKQSVIFSKVSWKTDLDLKSWNFRYHISFIDPRTFRIFMTYPPPPPPSSIHNVEDILFSKKCSRVSLQQHCFRGEGGANTKSQKFLHEIVGTLLLWLCWQKYTTKRAFLS